MKKIKTYDKTDGLPENVYAEYISDSKKGPDGISYVADHLDIYKDGKLIKSIESSLDPYIIIKDNYILMSADGQFDAFNVLNEKHYHQQMDLVLFGFEAEYSDRDDKDEPLRLTITGVGCYWGMEWLSIDVKFRFLINPKRPLYDLVLEEYSQVEREEENNE